MQKLNTFQLTCVEFAIDRTTVVQYLLSVHIYNSQSLILRSIHNGITE